MPGYLSLSLSLSWQRLHDMYCVTYSSSSSLLFPCSQNLQSSVSEVWVTGEVTQPAASPAYLPSRPLQITRSPLTLKSTFTASLLPFLVRQRHPSLKPSYSNKVTQPNFTFTQSTLVTIYITYIIIVCAHNVSLYLTIVPLLFQSLQQLRVSLTSLLPRLTSS